MLTRLARKLWMISHGWTVCYSLLVLKKGALFVIKTVSNKNCFFSRLEGYIHILDDEGEFGVTKKF